MTLRQLVDVARLNKAAELAAATTRLAGAPLPGASPAAAPPLASDAPDGLPRLWSLMAAGDRWRAEVVLDGRVHAIDAGSGPAVRIGAWRAVGLTPEGLSLERSAARGHPPHRLLLPPPERGVAAAGYRFDAPEGLLASPAAERPDPRSLAHDDRGDRGDRGDLGDGGSNGAAVHRAAALPMPAVPAPSSASAP